MSLADATHPHAGSPFLQHPTNNSNHNNVGGGGSAASSAASSSLSSSDAANAASVPLTLAMSAAGTGGGVGASAQVPIYGTQQTLSGTMGGAERSAKVSRCFGNTTLCMPQTLLCFKVRLCT